MNKIMIIGGDGFCGWPTALHLSSKSHKVAIVDNLSHRAIDTELGANSLNPIASIEDRITAWKEVSGKDMAFAKIDVATDYDGLHTALANIRPDIIIHSGEQRAAPYSMKVRPNNARPSTTALAQPITCFAPLPR